LQKTKRHPEALEAFRAAAAKDFSPSLGMLGLMYMNGDGVAKDVTKARTFLESAVGLGNVFAKRSLGTLLLRGEFGAIARLRGAWLFLMGFRDVLVVVWTDPSGGRLR
jgi:TPR repeat protein